MQTIQQLEKAGNTAIRNLRIQKLRDGIPFMINSNELPKRQCYLEYADGKIQLVYLASGSMDFTLIRELTKKEADAIRRKYNLL